jgi:DNA-binding ferritin-like protein (Dps family)
MNNIPHIVDTGASSIEPAGWMGKDYDGLKTDLYFDVKKNKLPYRLYESAIPLYTQDQLEEARKLGMQQERALWNLSASTQEIMDIHPANLTLLEIADAMELVFGEQIEEQFGNDLEEFARAILRKAQEK